MTGADHPLTKVGAGGWSHRRIQQRAEETWRQNMGELADELVAVSDRVDPVLVALGGDERATTILTEALPQRVRERLRPVDATRAADGSIHDLDEQVEGLLEEHAERELARTVEVYDQELGQDDRAAAGPAATLAALRAARVSTLLSSLGLDDGRQAFLTPGTDQVATTPDRLPDPAEAQLVPLVDGAVVAALVTGADVRVLSEQAAPPGGIGALLRW